MNRAQSRSSPIFSCVVILCFFFPGIFSLTVTLESIQIFTTHEWLPAKPTIYFQCQGENIIVLPDVKETYALYTFKGKESWQPLAELQDKKCKRCGLYEKDGIKPDDVFDEWELCPDDFVDGKYIRFKEKEFNATYACPSCKPPSGDGPVSISENGAADHKLSVPLVIMISTLVSTVVITGVIVGFKYWQKKKREQDQLRFLKLFEEGDDDIEDELGLGRL